MMKKTTLVLLLCCVFTVALVHAQESTGELPYSFKNDLPKIEASPKVMIKLDGDALRASSNARKGSGILMCSQILSAKFTPENSGSWVRLKNGDRLWRLEIQVPGALGTSLYYDNFNLPEGAKLFVYSKAKDEYIGAFTSSNNQKHKFFATEIVRSSTCVVEYLEPANVKGLGKFTISGVAHVYLPSAIRAIPNARLKDFGGSGSCNVNVNCPEGANWQNQKRAVARIYLKQGSGGGFCSGTLINNTAQNDKPYLLTADHCAGSAASSDFNQWVFYFSYEAPGCSNPSSEPVAKTVTGCVQRARSGNAGNGDSDFQLLELSPIPSSYNVFLAGWDARNTPSASGVSIHHPDADIKKISTYTSALQDNDGTHWRVNWVQTQTNWGITEPGSSGSGLFNSAGQLVGDLTGGASACDVPTSSKWDIYGKVSYSWTSNGTAANRQLKPWLDPTNSGATTLNGKNPGNNPGGTAPVVSITSPANGATFSSGATITINATATDADGNSTITGVTFYANGQALGTDTSSPYSYTWTGASNGTHQLTARATDNTNLTGTSSAVTITVGSTPTGNDITDSPGTISAQYTDSPAGEDIAKVIDNSSSTKYLTFHNAGWIQFQSTGSYVVTKYAITSANDAEERDPLTWTFSGSTNGSSWSTLDSRSNEDFSSRFQRREFSFSNATAYTYYRLQMTNNSGTILQLAEWEIYGTGGTTPTDVATVYQHCSYGGYAIPLPVGTYTLANLLSRGMLKDNDISSLRVTSGYRVILYDGDNATGATLTKTADDDCLVNDSFNDRATSVRVESVGKFAEIESSETFRSYPNPSRGVLNIIDGARADQIQLIDFDGKLVRSWNGAKGSSVDINGITPGTYWIRVYGKENKRIEKIIIE
jgi:hypothetical protein